MYELKETLLKLSEAVEAVHNANHALDYYGGHGDTEAMKKLFARIALVRFAVKTFDNKHGKKL